MSGVETAIIGLDCKMYYNSATWASPTWVEVDIARDVTLKRQKGEADVSNRASRYRKRKATLIDAEVTTEMSWMPGNSIFAEFQSAFDNDTPIELLILDGPQSTAGSQGLRAMFEVFTFDRKEPLEGGVMTDVVLKPTFDATNEPVWYTAT